MAAPVYNTILCKSLQSAVSVSTLQDPLTCFNPASNRNVGKEGNSSILYCTAFVHKVALGLRYVLYKQV